MKYAIYLKEALLCLKANRLRSFLALLGLLIGTASVVALITLGFLAKHAVLEQFNNLGMQKLLVNISSDNQDDLIKINNLIFTPNFFSDKPSRKHLEPKSNQQNIFNSKYISQTHPLKNIFKSTYFNSIPLQTYQIGITQSINKALKLKISQGRLISDQDTMRYYAVVGKEIADDFNLKINNDITIGDDYFTIIGILDYWPVDPLFAYNINRTILLPITTAQYLTNDYKLSEIYIDLNPNSTPASAENYLREIFNYIIPNAHLQFTNAEQILNQLESQAKILTILLGAIGAISLIVGAIGVMNIMLVAIVERKSEIGLRMAIGANPQEIKLQFLCETICLTSIGGVLGTILGVLIPYIITIIAGWNFTLPLFAVLFGLTISLGVGVMAGFYPAIQASRLLPVTCLNNI